MKKRNFDDYVKQFRNDDADFSKSNKPRNKFFSPSKPSKTGESTETRLRIVPRLDENGDYQDFFVAVNRHNVTIDGQFKPLVCPGPSVCPLCQLRKELESKKHEYPELMSQLFLRTRHYARIMVEPFEQHLDGENGPWLYIWDFAKKTKKQLEAITMTKKTLLDDFSESGRDLNLTCSRVGPNRMDIRYEIIDFDPSPVDQSLHSLSELSDQLDELISPASMELLHQAAAELDPRPASKRAKPAPYVPEQPAAVTPPPAPPRAAPPPPPPAVTIGEWHHSCDGSAAQSELTSEEVAQIVNSNPLGNHMVWKEGLSGWVEATSISEISSKVSQPGKPPAPPVPEAPQVSSPVPPPPGPPRPPQGPRF